MCLLPDYLKTFVLSLCIESNFVKPFSYVLETLPVNISKDIFFFLKEKKALEFPSFVALHDNFVSWELFEDPVFFFFMKAHLPLMLTFLVIIGIINCRGITCLLKNYFCKAITTTCNCNYF